MSIMLVVQEPRLISRRRAYIPFSACLLLRCFLTKHLFRFFPCSFRLSTPRSPPPPNHIAPIDPKVNQLASYRMLVEEAHDLISAHSNDVNAIFTYASGGFARLLGVDPKVGFVWSSERLSCAGFFFFCM